MGTKIMRFLEVSVQAFTLVGVWRGASAMMANSATAEQLGALHTFEPLAIPATLLAVLGSVSAIHLGFRRWRRLQKVAGKGRVYQPRLADTFPALGDQSNQVIADLQIRLLQLSEEKELLVRLLREKSESLKKDPLTGVFNRLAYEEQIQSEYQRWKRFGHPLTFLIWDIDHFKQVNDQYGHAVGDTVLHDVAQQLASQIRSTDFVARYGGEEFVMLLPGATAEAALKVADKLRSSIAESEFGSNGAKLSVTISCGLSSFQPGDSPESVFERADHALYQAKRAGRNRCQRS